MIFFLSSFSSKKLVRNSDGEPVHFLVSLPTIGSYQIVLVLEVLVVGEVAAYYVCLGLVVAHPDGVSEVHKSITRLEMVVCGVELGLNGLSPEVLARIMVNSLGGL